MILRGCLFQTMLQGRVQLTNNMSGQIIIFHQPRFHWNKGISLTKPPFGVSSCEVVIIWPNMWITSSRAGNNKQNTPYAKHFYINYKPYWTTISGESISLHFDLSSPELDTLSAQASIGFPIACQFIVVNENQPVIPNSKSLPLHTRTAHIRRIPLLNHTKPPSGKRKNHCQFIVTKAWHIHRVLKLDWQNQKSLTSDNSSIHRSQKIALQYIQLDIKHFPSVGRASLVNVSLLSPNLRPFFCPYIFFWGRWLHGF